jgi:predicted Ser/Thr protein kinase
MRDLVADILAEQRREWESGRHLLVEHFLEQHPELRQDEESSLDLIYGERLLRQEFGPRVPDESYVERFPHLAEKLRRQFAVDDLIDEAAASEELEGATLPHSGAAADATATLPEAPAAGRKLPSIPGYETLAVLGSGTFGVVYKVEQAWPLRRVLALKTIPADDRSEPLFYREIETLASIHDPAIVEVYSWGESEGRLYYTMEYVEGGTLEKRLRGDRMTVRAAAEFVEQLARAVGAVHGAGIIHRDLKPANVLLAKDGSPKVTDFGLARWVNADSSLTPSSAMVGTPQYMAPEQTRGKDEPVGPPADVWALGVILYEALTGRRPFEGKTLVTLLAAIQSADPAQPRNHRREVPRELEAIVVKCLEKDPRQRYESGRELAEDLGDWLDSRIPRRAKPRRWPARVWRFARRRPSLCGSVLGALLLAAAAVFAVWFLDPERPRNEAKADLRNGRPHEFRVRKWGPSPFRWVFGTPDKLSADSEANTLTIETLTTALYECLDDPGTDRYRFSMDVRHEDALGESSAGMFVCLRHGVRAEGVQQYGFFAFHFADQRARGPERDPAGEPVSRPYLHWCACEKSDFVQPEEFRRGPPFRPTLSWPKESKWRPMKVEVTGAGIAAYWQNDGGEWVPVRLLPSKEIETLLRRAKSTAPERSNLPVDYQPRSGLGIYVREGKASIRNIRLEPLPG